MRDQHLVKKKALAKFLIDLFLSFHNFLNFAILAQVFLLHSSGPVFQSDHFAIRCFLTQANPNFPNSIPQDSNPHLLQKFIIEA